MKRSIIQSEWFVGVVCFLLGGGLMLAYSDYLLHQEWSYSAKLRDRITQLEGQVTGQGH